MTNLICITCPKGCHLTVDEDHDYAVTGNACARGAEYGRNELQNPVRVVTSTVRITGAATPRVPVKTQGAIPKGKMFEIMRALDAVTLQAPVKTGEVVIANVCGTGVDITATKSAMPV